MTIAEHDRRDPAKLVTVPRPSRLLQDHKPFIGPVSLGFDFACLVLTGLLTSMAYHLVTYGHGATMSAIAYFLLVAAIMVTLRSARNDYAPSALLTQGSNAPLLLRDWLTSIAMPVALSFLMGDAGANSRGAVLLFGMSGYAVLLGGRRLSQILLFQSAKTARIETRRAVLIGERQMLADYYARERVWQRGIGIAASVTLRGGQWSEGLSVWVSSSQQERSSVLLSNLAENLRALQADDVVLVMPWSNTAPIQSLLNELSKLPATIYLAPDVSLSRIELGALGRINISNLLVDHSTGLPGIRLSRQPLTPLHRLAKRSFDFVAALAGLIILSPFFLGLAVAIALESKGSPIFRQARNGFNERPFYIYKFRSMRAEPQTRFQQTQRDDDRITRIGRFIRRTNIDELPQLLNVLLGDMSLVGPRPHAIEHNHAFMTQLSNYARRHHVKPGITGWAQVKGARGAAEDEASMSLRLRYDLEYIQNWSFWMDINILFLTVASKKAFRNAF